MLILAALEVSAVSADFFSTSHRWWPLYLRQHCRMPILTSAVFLSTSHRWLPLYLIQHCQMLILTALEVRAVSAVCLPAITDDHCTWYSIVKCLSSRLQTSCLPAIADDHSLVRSACRTACKLYGCGSGLLRRHTTQQNTTRSTKNEQTKVTTFF
jgi:hypothetical protein